MTIAFWQQYGAWVTALQTNLFVWARIKLTLLYLLVTTVIIGVFSLVFYYYILEAIQINIARTFMDEFFQAIIIQNVSQRTRNVILFGDFFILLIATATSYFLAGKTLRPIQKVMQLQQLFTADASHELRTPLTILKTDIEVSLRQIDFQAAPVRQLLESNLEEVNRLARLSEQLLLLLKSEGTPAESVKKAIILQNVVNHIIQKLQAVANEKHIRLTSQTADIGVLVGSREQIEAVLLNVIHNALAHVPNEGGIEVSVVSNPTALELTVRDSGSGIDPQDLPYVFQRFYKADKSRNPTQGGAGLGLAIVHEIVEQHHGQIHITSTLGKGTIVTVQFPRYA